MAHKFRIDNSCWIWNFGQINKNNNIDGVGMMYNHKTKGYIIGRFNDGKPAGVFCTNLSYLLNINDKPEENICIQTEPTEKCPNFFRIYVRNEQLWIYIYEDGKITDKPHTILVAENQWSVAKKGSKDFDVNYLVKDTHKALNPIRLLSRGKISANKAYEKSIKRIDDINLDPLYCTYSVPKFPEGIHFIDKRNSLQAEGTGPCISYNWATELEFLHNDELTGLRWLDIQKKKMWYCSYIPI